LIFLVPVAQFDATFEVLLHKISFYSLYQFKGLFVSSTTMDDSTKPHVIIIGSGCSGLLVAQGLRKVSILESINSIVTASLIHANLIDRGEFRSASMIRSTQQAVIEIGV
jgi:hypothetical protein